MYSFSAGFVFNRENGKEGGGKDIICMQGKLLLHEHSIFGKIRFGHFGALKFVQ